MEPLKQNDRRQILAARPLAAEEDLDEYEALLAARFTRDPDAPAPLPAPHASGGSAGPESDDETRLAELHKKLFGDDSD